MQVDTRCMERTNQDLDTANHSRARTAGAREIQRTQAEDQRHKRDELGRTPQRTRQAGRGAKEGNPGDSSARRVLTDEEGNRVEGNTRRLGRVGEAMGRQESQRISLRADQVSNLLYPTDLVWVVIVRLQSSSRRRDEESGAYLNS